MCPLRFILVFFSAALAGYFAWRSFRSPSLEDDGDAVLMSTEDSAGKRKKKNDEKVLVGENDQGKMMCVTRVVRDGFWVFVDMASGRYLWRNFKQMRKE